MLTKRGSPLDINFKFLNGEIQYRMIIDSQLLDTLTKDADSILFVDLIKRMIKKNPDQRQTSEDLIDHAALKNDKEWLEIVQLMAGKCFSGDKCINEYLVQIIDKKEVHMKGSLAEDSAEWKELIAEVAKLSVKPNLKACSSLLMIFSEQVFSCSWMVTSIFLL